MATPHRHTRNQIAEIQEAAVGIQPHEIALCGRLAERVGAATGGRDTRANGGRPQRAG
jgi:hypothetical protein